MDTSARPSGSHLVTTYVRQQPLFAYDGNKGDTLPDSLRRLGLQPHYSRVHAAVRLLASWDGRDALLQAVQAVTLLVYSFAPIRRRQLHIASESVANTRKVLILGRWLAGVIDVARGGLRADNDKDDSDASSSTSIDGAADETDEKLRSDYYDDLFASSDEDPAVKAWRRAREKRTGSLAEWLNILGDGCEVAALLGGSSVLSRVMGGKLAARQRKGLERIALFFLFFAFSLGLRHVELQRQRRVRALRMANARLIQATDRLAAEADAKTLFSAHRLSPEQALQLHRDQAQSRKSDTAITSSFTEKGNDSTAHAQQYDNDDSLQHIEASLRRAETTVFMQRKEMQLLHLERTSLRAELVFVAAELVWPRHDHTRLEGWTSMITALCNMSRLAKESRWQR